MKFSDDDLKRYQGHVKNLYAANEVHLSMDEFKAFLSRLEAAEIRGDALMQEFEKQHRRFLDDSHFMETLNSRSTGYGRWLIAVGIADAQWRQACGK